DADFHGFGSPFGGVALGRGRAAARGNQQGGGQQACPQAEHGRTFLHGVPFECPSCTGSPAHFRLAAPPRRSCCGPPHTAASSAPEDVAGDPCGKRPEDLTCERSHIV